MSPHLLTGGLPSLIVPSLPSLSLPTRALGPLKEPLLHNFPSTLSTSHTLRKATLRTYNSELGSEGRGPCVLHTHTPPETLQVPYLPVYPKEQAGLRSHPPSSLPLAPE